jgi:uncharacterized caspase-like protein
MKLTIAAAIVGLSLTASSSAQAGRNKALIIGNAHYLYITSLAPEPINDANRVALALQANGFAPSDETVKFDLDKKQMSAVIEGFVQSLQPDDSVIFYFSGHGYSVEGSGYLAPVDISVPDDTTKAAAREAGYSLLQLFSYLGRAHLRVVILDACRSDPHLEKQITKDTSNSFQVRPLTAEAPPSGAVVAFATSAGATAALNSPDNLSFYTHYLAINLATQPATLLDALQKTKTDVINASSGKQIPAIYDESSAPIILSRVGVGRSPQIAPETSTQQSTSSVPQDEDQAQFNQCIQKKVERCMSACLKFVSDYHYTEEQWSCSKFACAYDDRNLTGLSKSEKKISQAGTNYYAWTRECGR